MNSLYAVAVSMLILRSGIEEKAKAERRQNEGRAKDERTPIEERVSAKLTHGLWIFKYKYTKNTWDMQANVIIF